MNNQTERILEALSTGAEIDVIELHRAGSGTKHGVVGSISRRISDIREFGFKVDCRIRFINGKKHTFYQITGITATAQ